MPSERLTPAYIRLMLRSGVPRGQNQFIGGVKCVRARTRLRSIPIIKRSASRSLTQIMSSERGREGCISRLKISLIRLLSSTVEVRFR